MGVAIYDRWVCSVYRYVKASAQGVILISLLREVGGSSGFSRGPGYVELGGRLSTLTTTMTPI